MNGTWLDEPTTDRLLCGRLAPDDAPPGLAHVAVLVRALKAPPSADELAGETRAVAAAVTLVRDALSSPSPPESARAASPSRKAHSRFFRTKVTSLVVVGTLVGTTGLAAAGVLPAPLQDAASAVLSKVGISVPDSTGSTHPASSGDEISKIATTTHSTGVGKGAEISSVASGGKSQAGLYGKGHPGGSAGAPGKQSAPGQQEPPGQQSAPGKQSAPGQQEPPGQAKGGHPAQGSGKPR